MSDDSHKKGLRGHKKFLALRKIADDYVKHGGVVIYEVRSRIYVSIEFIGGKQVVKPSSYGFRASYDSAIKLADEHEPSEVKSEWTCIGNDKWYSREGGETIIFQVDMYMDED